MGDLRKRLKDQKLTIKHYKDKAVRFQRIAVKLETECILLRKENRRLLDKTVELAAARIRRLQRLNAAEPDDDNGDGAEGE